MTGDDFMEEDPLDKVPSYIKGPCNLCGSIEWDSANMDMDEFTQCSDCHEYDPIEKKLKPKQRH